jgi:adenylyltransferase/sulfurtransferase
MFSMSEKPIDSLKLSDRLRNPRCGAKVCFDGIVRNHNEGRQVKGLEYQAYIEMALSEGRKIIKEAHRLFEIDQAEAVHRFGHLEIEDTAVWVGVTSAHRKASFDACRYIIDQIKIRLPIWKREQYSDDEHRWVDCQNCSTNFTQSYDDLKTKVYQGQTRLKEIGRAGQSQLERSRVAVIGAGALGCASLPYIAAAGIGNITIFDPDLVDATNLHRQTLYSLRDVNQPKAKLAAKRLQEQNRFSNIVSRVERIDKENIEKNLQAFDVILDCTDNFEAKFLLHDFAYLKQIPLVQADIFKFEIQLNVYRDFDRGCLRCLWPNGPGGICSNNCAEIGILGSTAGIAGAFQAQEVIKILLGVPSLKDNEMLLIDLIELRQEKIQKPRDVNCSICSVAPNPMPPRMEHTK